MERPIAELLPNMEGGTVMLSPDEVDRLETLGYIVLPPAIMPEKEDDGSGRRPCLVYSKPGAHT